MIFKKPKEINKSPLKRKPMNSPGESLQREMERLLSEDFFPLLMAAMYIVIFASYSWGQWYFKWQPRPIEMTIVAVFTVGYTIYKFFQVRKYHRNLKQGLAGEKAVGQFLELIRDQDCRVFHDITADNSNIDHIYISPKGIFVIETKTYSKPPHGKSTINFDGERILVNGFEPERNPINQVRGLTQWLQDMLFESTGRKFPIKGVVVFPGWFIDNKTKTRSNFWVLNPRALPAYIENESNVLKMEEVALIASRINTHMQNLT